MPNRYRFTGLTTQNVLSMIQLYIQTGFEFVIHDFMYPHI